MTETPRLIGVLPTYRRTELLGPTLAALSEQSRVLDRLVVVDNEGSDAHAIPRGDHDHRRMCDRVPLARREPGLRRRSGRRHAPRARVRAGRRLDRPARRRRPTSVPDRPRDARCVRRGDAGSGSEDGRDRDQRRLVRLASGTHAPGPGRRPHGPGSRRSRRGQSAAVLPRRARSRDVGVFYDDLFFGFSELEFGLRLWRAGYSLYGYGPLWLESRKRTGRLQLELRPSRRLCGRSAGATTTASGTRSSSCRRFGRPGTAFRVTLVQGLAKPIVNLPLSPTLALQHLRIQPPRHRHGWLGRMGRRVEPDGGLRAGKAQERSPIRGLVNATRIETTADPSTVGHGRAQGGQGRLPPPRDPARSPGARCRDPRVPPRRYGRGRDRHADLDLHPAAGPPRVAR